MDDQAQSKRLSRKQEAFVAAYLGEARFNGTRAAIIAGYSVRSAHAIAHENLKKPEIASRVRTELDARAMPAEGVLAELTAIAAADWRDFVQVLATDDDGNPTKVRSDIGSKVKALELLGKHHQLFVDNLNISGGIELHEFEGISKDVP